MTSNEKHGAVYGDDGMLYLYVGSNAFYLHITVVMSLHITVVMSLYITVVMSLYITVVMSLHITVVMSLHITVVMSLHITVVMSLHIFTLQGSMKIGCPFLPHLQGSIKIWKNICNVLSLGV